MKKISVIAVLLLSTGLTALSISTKAEKAEIQSKKATIAEKTEAVTSTKVLATADWLVAWNYDHFFTEHLPADLHAVNVYARVKAIQYSYGFLVTGILISIK